MTDLEDETAVDLMKAQAQRGVTLTDEGTSFSWMSARVVFKTEGDEFGGKKVRALARGEIWRAAVGLRPPSHGGDLGGAAGGSQHFKKGRCLVEKCCSMGTAPGDELIRPDGQNGTVRNSRSPWFPLPADLTNRHPV